MAEIEEELKRLFMRVMEESEKSGLKLNIQDFRGAQGLTLPYNAGDTGLIPGRGPKIPHALEQLESSCISTKDFT